MVGSKRQIGAKLRYLIIGLVLLLVGCGEQAGEQTSAAAVIEVWAHAGRAAERQVLERRRRVCSSQKAIRVRLIYTRQSYNAQIQAAAVAGDLPGCAG